MNIYHPPEGYYLTKEKDIQEMPKIVEATLRTKFEVKSSIEHSQSTKAYEIQTHSEIIVLLGNMVSENNIVSFLLEVTSKVSDLFPLMDKSKKHYFPLEQEEDKSYMTSLLRHKEKRESKTKRKKIMQKQTTCTWSMVFNLVSFQK